MAQKVSPNVLLGKLDQVVQRGMKQSVIARAHKELLVHMQNDHNPAPDWDKFPIGRDYWLQVDPVGE